MAGLLRAPRRLGVWSAVRGACRGVRCASGASDAEKSLHELETRWESNPLRTCKD